MSEAEVAALTTVYGPVALKELARLAMGAESEQARVAACKELLDRAYGKPIQPIDASDSHPPVLILTVTQIAPTATPAITLPYDGINRLA